MTQEQARFETELANKAYRDGYNTGLQDVLKFVDSDIDHYSRIYGAESGFAIAVYELRRKIKMLEKKEGGTSND